MARKKKEPDLLDIPDQFKRVRPPKDVLDTDPDPVDREGFYDSAALEEYDLIPGRMAYIWLYGTPGPRGQGGDGVEWPVSGWAPYLVWRWTDKHVELWYPTQLARVRVPRNHVVLKRVRCSPGDGVTPARVAERLRRAIDTYNNLGMSYPYGVTGVMAFLEKLESFDDAVEPAPFVEDETSGHGEGSMPRLKDETPAKGGRKGGSGAFIREQLVAMHNGKAKKRTDEELAAEARQKFGGKTGVSDIAWNRNKLRKDGDLPPSERGKGKPPAAKPAKGKGKKMDAKSAKVPAAA